MEKAEVFIHVSDAVFIAFRLRVPLLVWMHLLPLRHPSTTPSLRGTPFMAGFFAENPHS